VPLPLLLLLLNSLQKILFAGCWLASYGCMLLCQIMQHVQESVLL
jgi:hypothetical protein